MKHQQKKATIQQKSAQTYKTQIEEIEKFELRPTKAAD